MASFGFRILLALEYVLVRWLYEGKSYGRMCVGLTVIIGTLHTKNMTLKDIYSQRLNQDIKKYRAKTFQKLSKIDGMKVQPI
ncbi:hypothetical protein CIPAW_08G112500 [Carya illinoinensis]|uniref:Uncharacterized protein n=1 Tax=Carya illinoinensis TaxID=32201 RepID=A0A8T1PU25_CARIL|nr:hypothetical protein CIPAW_08G112500 [Carya illinoinensis]